MVVVLHASAFAQIDPARSAGFKQLRIGMTRDQVNAIVAATHWSDYAGTTNDEEINFTCSGDNEIEPACDSVFFVAHKVLKGDEYYANAHYILVSFYHDTLYQIAIASRSVAEEDVILPYTFCKLSAELIEAKYGRPTDRDKSLASLASKSPNKLAKAMVEGSTLVAEFNLSPAKYSSKQVIRVYVYRSEDADKPLDGWIRIYDEEMADRRREEMKSQP
jgi:hypothetical protein